MRSSLEKLIKDTIMLQYELPYSISNIDKSCITSEKDICFSTDDSKKVSSVIYNSIVEYSKNEYFIDYEQLSIEQIKALQFALRYEEDASDLEKQKYGFFGEVLLDAILRVHMGTQVLISKGYFYNPLENAEAKGYDLFHLIEGDDKTELWFGESKFYLDGNAAISKILNNLENVLQPKYFDKNVISIIKFKDVRTSIGSKFDRIIEKWEDNPDIIISDEVKNLNMKLIYPMFVAYEIDKKCNYEADISKRIEYISNEVSKKKFKNGLPFDISLFFIFLPLTGVSLIKKDVIEWISIRKPLI